MNIVLVIRLPFKTLESTLGIGKHSFFIKWQYDRFIVWRSMLPQMSHQKEMMIKVYRILFSLLGLSGWVYEYSQALNLFKDSTRGRPIEPAWVSLNGIQFSIVLNSLQAGWKKVTFIPKRLESISGTAQIHRYWSFVRYTCRKASTQQMVVHRDFCKLRFVIPKLAVIWSGS